MTQEELKRSIGQTFPKLDARFVDILLELMTLHERKTTDYGAIDHPECNLYASSEFGIAPEVGVMLRMNDKWKRLKQFARSGTLANESVEDSFMDLANYSLLALFVRRKGKKEQLKREIR